MKKCEKVVLWTVPIAAHIVKDLKDVFTLNVLIANIALTIQLEVPGQSKVQNAYVNMDMEHIMILLLKNK